MRGFQSFFSMMLILVLLFFSAVCQSCIGSGARNITLTAGEDYIGNRGGGADIPDASGGYNNYVADNNESASHVVADASPQPAYTPPVPAKPRGLPDVSRWFSPAACAAELGSSEQYLVRTCELDVRTDDVEKAVQQAGEVAKRYGGVVTDSQVQKEYEEQLSGYVTLRVPSARFGEAWGELLKLGEVLNRKIDSQDVSQEYVSDVSHLNTMLAEQATLQKMLSEALAVQRSRGLGDAYKVLLDTQARLSEVTSSIREIEDKVAVLADQITRSTITVNLTERAVIKREGFDWGLGAYFNRAVLALLGCFRFLAQAVIYVLVVGWLWIVPLVLLVLWWRKLLRKWRAARAAQPAMAIANAAPPAGISGSE